MLVVSGVAASSIMVHAFSRVGSGGVTRIVLFALRVLTLEAFIACGRFPSCAPPRDKLIHVRLCSYDRAPFNLWHFG